MPWLICLTWLHFHLLLPCNNNKIDIDAWSCNNINLYLCSMALQSFLLCGSCIMFSCGVSDDVHASDEMVK